MTALEQLQAAEAALASATTDRDKLEKTRDASRARALDLEAKRKDLEGELSNRLVDVVMGGTATLAIDTLREEIATLAREKTEAEGVAKACESRIVQAKQVEASARRTFDLARGVVADPLVALYLEKRNEAWRAFCEYSVTWMSLRATRGLPSTGQCLKEGLQAIANAAKVDFFTFGRLDGQEAPRMSGDELRVLAATDDGLE